MLNSLVLYLVVNGLLCTPLPPSLLLLRSDATADELPGHFLQQESIAISTSRLDRNE
jgi:hypothetical protein